MHRVNFFSDDVSSEHDEHKIEEEGESDEMGLIVDQHIRNLT
jgi:hypothetical protein